MFTTSIFSIDNFNGTIYFIKNTKNVQIMRRRFILNLLFKVFFWNSQIFIRDLLNQINQIFMPVPISSYIFNEIFFNIISVSSEI